MLGEVENFVFKHKILNCLCISCSINDFSLIGHVAHHFFFTKIPHYHLMEATAAIKNVLKSYNVYRCKSNADFLLDYLTLNVKLEYLIGRGTGILTYARKRKTV